MKILLVVHDFWPRHKAGTENATYFLASRLSRMGHDVHIFTKEFETERGIFIDQYEESGFKVFKVHQKNREIRKLDDLYHNPELEKIFQEYVVKIKPDIAHVQHLIGLSLNFINILKSNGIPVAYTLHDFWFECPQIRCYRSSKNCSMSQKECNKCLCSDFPNLKKEIENNFLISTLDTWSKKRYVKRLVHITTKYLKLLDFIHFFSKKKNLIDERNKIFLKIFRKVDFFITPSDFLKKRALSFGIPKNKIVSISHGIEKDLKSPKFDKKTTKNKFLTFGFLSHISEDKGFFTLINSFIKFKNNYPLRKDKLLLFGSYDKKNFLVKKFLKKIEKRDDIVYMGIFNNKDLSNILKKIDVSIIPSLWQEIYGLVLDESFLFDTPVLVSKRGALPERVRNDINGLVFDPDKKNDLYKKIKYLSFNPDRVNFFRRNIPNIKSIEEYAKEIEKIYEKILANQKRA